MAKQLRGKTGVALDERQKHFVLKSYQYGFAFTIFSAWLGLLLTSMLPNLFSPIFWFVFILFGGLAVNVTYATLKGAHPLVDPRFEKHGHLMGIGCLLYGLVTILMTGWEMVSKHLDVNEFFSHGGSGSMLILGLSLFAMGSSITYRRYLDKREEED